MKCLNCAAVMSTARENYKYEESGLSCITLVGMEVTRCKKCGESEVAIPAITELHQAIARVIVLKPERLVPEEIRFFRKHLGLSQADIAAQLGVAIETVSRWENGKERMSVPAEKLLRFLVARKEPIARYEKELSKVAVGEARCSKLDLSRHHNRWRPISVAS